MLCNGFLSQSVVSTELGFSPSGMMLDMSLDSRMRSKARFRLLLSSSNKASLIKQMSGSGKVGKAKHSSTKQTGPWIAPCKADAQESGTDSYTASAASIADGVLNSLALNSG